MGTSLSQGSPGTTSWRAVAACYRTAAIEPQRVVEEVWRAAHGDPDADWARMLSSPLIARCLEIAESTPNAGAALRQAGREIAEAKGSSIATEVAKRAVARSFRGDDQRQSFVSALFGEATNYLVSRDLASHVGQGNRSETVRDAVSFKNAVQDIAEQTVSRLSPKGTSRSEWRAFVSDTVQHLSGRQR